jgi:cyanophycin synthetase
MRRRSDTAEFTALLVGDIGFGEPYFGHPRALELKQLYATAGYGSSLRRVSDLLAAADLRIGNLEVPLAPAPDPILQGHKKYLGWSDPDETVRALVKARFDAVSIANNHSLDGGEQGLRSTIQKLHKAGIASFGADMDQTAASQPFMKTVRFGASERTIVVFGCFEHRGKYEQQYKWYAGPDRPGINPILPEIIAAQIKALRAAVPSPFFIVYPHWGTDYLDIQQSQREYAGQLVSAGADLIVGHGAHVMQGVEKVAGRIVVYGLGNFVWNSPGRYAKLQATPYSLAAAVCFRRVDDRETVSLRLYPLLTDNAVTKFQSRRVSAAEFPDALSVLTRNLDGPTGKAGLHEDPCGSYLEIPVDAVR